jgi:hypothetical protein
VERGGGRREEGVENYAVPHNISLFSALKRYFITKCLK